MIQSNISSSSFFFKSLHGCSQIFEWFVVPLLHDSILFELNDTNHFSDHVPSLGNSLVKFLFTIRRCQGWNDIMIAIGRITRRTIIYVAEGLFPSPTNILQSKRIVVADVKGSLVQVSYQGMHCKVRVVLVCMYKYCSWQGTSSDPHHERHKQRAALECFLMSSSRKARKRKSQRRALSNRELCREESSCMPESSRFGRVTREPGERLTESS
jgi:hypothetical protein